jgi:hypothetical protein
MNEYKAAMEKYNKNKAKVEIKVEEKVENKDNEVTNGTNGESK